ncbi:MAG: hypothetical protein JW955_14395 [Sedimentisphaerales bacterium]|nr:hypothetical protein [Sedimentisphaerales bacterium]
MAETSILTVGTGRGYTALHFCSGILSHRLFPLIAALLAMAMALPSLRSGLQGDDLWYRCAMERPPGLERIFQKPGAFNLVADGDPERTRRMMNLGLLPWWSCPDFRLSFLRPVSNLTHRLDFALWPKDASLMHLHNILWYGAWTFCIAILYRRMIPIAWVAGLAAFLFAIDDAHALPACWIASRNTVIGATFAVVSLLLHDVWRRKRAWPWAFLSTAAFGLALLSKESAIGICAYLFAYALFMDTGGTKSRAWSLMPYALTALLWQTSYRALGLGVSDSRFYTDPAGSPLSALRAVFERGPILLFGQWGFPPAETVWLLTPAGRHIFWFAAVIWLAVLLYFLVPLLKTERTARFFFAGMLLATVPACMGMVTNRMLEYVGIGGIGLLAMLLNVLARQWKRSAQVSNPWPGRIVLSALVSFHFICSPVSFFISHWKFSEALANRDDLLARVAVLPDLAGKTIIFPSPPHASYASYLQIHLALAGQPLPAHVWALAPGYFAHEREATRCTRLDPYRLQIERTSGIPIQLERGRRRPLCVGDRIELDGMTVTISQVDSANLPKTLVFAFSEPLESPSMVWLAVAGNKLSPWSPPGVGETVPLGERWKDPDREP